MPRTAIRTVLVTLAVLLGLGAGGAALAATLREPGPTDLGPSISVTQSGPPAPAGEPGPAGSTPPSPTPTPTAPSSPAAPARVPEGNEPVPVQPAPPQDYDDDDGDDWDDDGGDDD